MKRKIIGLIIIIFIGTLTAQTGELKLDGTVIGNGLIVDMNATIIKTVVSDSAAGVDSTACTFGLKAVPTGNCNGLTGYVDVDYITDTLTAGSDSISLIYKLFTGHDYDDPRNYIFLLDSGEVGDTGRVAITVASTDKDTLFKEWTWMTIQLYDSTRSLDDSALIGLEVIWDIDVGINCNE